MKPWVPNNPRESLVPVPHGFPLPGTVHTTIHVYPCACVQYREREEVPGGGLERRRLHPERRSSSWLADLPSLGDAIGLAPVFSITMLRLR